MSRAAALLGWLEDKSDWLSPIVVKEVRQVVRGREFNYAFGASLVAALAVAFFGAADALSGNGTSGSWTFVSLMVCLGILGLIVVPLGAFSALRNERMEQTLDLITVTALSPRRVVIGKLLAQGVKLVTLFAGLAPFIAMSFLLGGIDFFTILISIAVVFAVSMWMSAAFLFLSTLLKSRAMSGAVFGGAGLVMIFLFVASRGAFFMIRGAGFGGAPLGSRSALWWTLAMAGTACAVTLVNLVLLSENRLAVATGNRVTPLRIGFLAQFFLIVAWTLTYLDAPPRAQANALDGLGVLGGLHLALVAMFTVTEDLVVPRRALLEMQRPSKWGPLLALVRPGGGRGAAYVLAQMGVLLAVALVFQPPSETTRWMLAICAYICFFTGVPTLAFRLARPAAAAALQLRVALLLLLPASMTLPDIFYYLAVQPAVFDLAYGRRHLVNPLRTLANWRLVESSGWTSAPFILGAFGVLAYVALIRIGARMTAEAPLDSQGARLVEGEAGSADALY